MMRTIIKTRRVETGLFFSSVANFDWLIFHEMRLEHFFKWKTFFQNTNPFEKTNVLLVRMLQKFYRTSLSRQIRWKAILY